MDGKKIGKIMGLDPAMETPINPSTQLNPESADYVECIYTGVGLLSPFCQANFYVNRGK